MFAGSRPLFAAALASTAFASSFSVEIDGAGAVAFPKPLKPPPNAEPRWLSGLSELPRFFTDSRAFGVVGMGAELEGLAAAETVRLSLPFE